MQLASLPALSSPRYDQWTILADPLPLWPHCERLPPNVKTGLAQSLWGRLGGGAVKIAYVCADPRISLLGDKGAAVQLRSLAEALARRGHAVHCFAARLDGPNPPSTNIAVAPLEEEALVATLRDRDCEVVIERHSLAAGASLMACRTLGLPYVLEVNTPLVDEAVAFQGLRDVRGWRAWERGALRAADAVIAASTGVRAHVIRSGVLPARAVVVHSGIDADRFRGRTGEWVRQQHALGSSPAIGFTGSLRPWQGVDLLLEAAAGLDPEVRVLIVGDGPQRHDLQMLARRLEIHNRVVFTGGVPHDVVPAFVTAMTVAAAPYRRQAKFYFSPLKVMEYLAAGVPVVASRQGDLATIVGAAGLLVPADDVDALRIALQTLLADPVRRQLLSDLGRSQAASFTWEAAAARVEAVLGSAIGGQTRPRQDAVRSL